MKSVSWQKVSRLFPYTTWLVVLAGLIPIAVTGRPVTAPPVSPVLAGATVIQAVITSSPAAAKYGPGSRNPVGMSEAVPVDSKSYDRSSVSSMHYEPLSDSPLLVTPEPAAIQTRPTPSFALHRVRPGETLMAIASMYGVATEALLVTNDIRDPTNLPVGQELIIPPSNSPRIRIVPHKIGPKDTLLSIAAKYGSSVKDILAVNANLSPTLLPVGQTLAVPVVFSQARPTPQPAGTAGPVFYTVEPGDVPLTIASEYEVPVELLLAANDITDPTRLQVGQQLVIPPADGLTMGVPIILYELTSGDTLLSIATRYGSSIKDILAVNPDLVPASLQAGETVAIPVIFDLPRPTPEPAAPLVRVTVSDPLVEMQQQMIDLVNAERQAAGLSPYKKDEQITQMAAAYAQDMVLRGYFSHVTPEGETLRDRFQAQGINGVYRVGEDIQRNTRPANETVQAALHWFMGSRPHRNNILHPSHNSIGVGIVEGPPGWYTFVLDFAQR